MHLLGVLLVRFECLCKCVHMEPLALFAGYYLHFYCLQNEQCRLSVTSDDASYFSAFQLSITGTADFPWYKAMLPLLKKAMTIIMNVT